MNDRHKKFCDEYLANGLNGTKAYLAVYPNVKKEDTARVNASKLLTNTNIINYLQEQQSKTSEKLQITRESLIADLQDIKNNNKEGNPQAALKSIELMAKMLGLNEPQKTETKITGDLNISKLFGFDDDDKTE